MRPRALLFALLALAFAILPLSAQEAPVRLDGQTLFTLKARVGSFTPAARAEALEQRLRKLAADPFNRPGRLEAQDSGESTDLLAGDTLLLTITEADARAENASRAELARRWSEAMLTALQAHSLAHRARALAWAGLESLGVTLGAILLAWLLALAFRRLDARIEASRRLGAFRVQQLELVSAVRMRHLARSAARLLRALMALVLAYAYLSLVFSFFPWTRGLASRLFGYLWAPVGALGEALLGYLPKLLFLAAIALATRWLLKLVKLLFEGLGSGALSLQGFHPDWAEPTYKLARLLVLAFALVIGFPYLPGSQSEAFKGVGLFVGLLFSLGSSGIVANMVAGVLITYMRPFRLGDVIEIGGTRGVVVEKSLLVTRVRTNKNVDVAVPNATVMGSQILNFSAQAGQGRLLLHTSVTIGYDAPWRQIHGLLRRAAAATEGVLSEPEPFVLQTSLDDFYVSYQLNVATDCPEEMAGTYSRLHQAIQDAFFEAGVEIMSPHYAALREGNAAAIPAEKLPAGYEAPAFRLKSQ